MHRHSQSHQRTHLKGLAIVALALAGVTAAMLPAKVHASSTVPIAICLKVSHEVGLQSEAAVDYCRG